MRKILLIAFIGSMMVSCSCDNQPEPIVEPVVNEIPVESFIDSSETGTQESQDYLDSQLKK